MPPTTAPYPRADISAAVASALFIANDSPQPDKDALHSSLKYAALAQNFRNGAWRHLDDGDLPQASNKAWGLVSETVKAISAEHGGFLHTHRSILEAVWGLARLPYNAGDVATMHQINNDFAVARSLHANFYEDDLPVVAVLSGLIKCEELSELLYALFWPAAPAR